MAVKSRLVTVEVAHGLDAAGYLEQVVGAGRPGRPRGWRMRAAGFEGGLPVAHDIDRAAAPAVAYVSEGRWVADCPSDGCNAAMLLLGDPAAGYLCGDCFNAPIDHRLRPVVWPDERAEIEAVLCARPVPATRSWTGHARPAWGITEGETVASLAAENESRGLPVPAHVAQRLAGRGGA